VLQHQKLRSRLSLGLIGVGIVLALAPLWTWLYGLANQALLSRQEPFLAVVPEERCPEEGKGSLASAAPANSPEDGQWPFTRLVIPKLGVDAVVVEGVDAASLRRGPGHYPGTALPGERGNVGIAGHRTTWGRWFRNLHQLEPGDIILLVTRTATYWYCVTGKWVTHAYDWSVVEPTPAPALTLTTCEPPGQAKQRLIVRAVLVAPGEPEEQP